MKKRFLLIAIVLLSVCTSYSQEFMVDSINYNVLNSTDVEVVALYSGKYEGDITIPTTVVYNNKTYAVVAVGSDAFKFCTTLTSIALPNNIETIGDNTFQSCWTLNTINLPNTLKTIGNNAFASCEALTSITFPQGLISIGNYAFQECVGLTILNLPTTLTTISNGSFNTCLGLTSLKLPEGIENIQEGAFYGCSNLEVIEFPESLTTLETNAFGYCTVLTEIIVKNNTPISINSDVFSLTPIGLIELTVPLESETGYKNSNVWKDFGTISQKEISDNTLTSKEISFENHFKLEVYQNIIKIISDDLNSVKRLEILNIGAKILKTSFSNTIDIFEVASGIYILKIETDQGIFTKKIVRQ